LLIFLLAGRILFSVVKETLKLLIGLEINSPMKADFKQSFLNTFVRYCESKGAENVRIEDSYYIMGERPERNRVFQIELDLRCRIKELVKICNDIFNYYHKLDNIVTIVVTRKDGWNGMFLKDSQKKGILRIIDSNKYHSHWEPAKIIDAEVYRFD